MPNPYRSPARFSPRIPILYAAGRDARRAIQRDVAILVGTAVASLLILRFAAGFQRLLLFAPWCTLVLTASSVLEDETKRARLDDYFVAPERLWRGLRAFGRMWLTGWMLLAA
jgi:hypothetical protein